MWSNFKKIEKIASITLGLLALVGITAYFSDGVNGQQIFSIAIMLIFVIIGISVFIPMIKRKNQYQDFNTSQNYQQYQNKNEGRQKTQNEDSFEYEEKIWVSKGRDGRKELCRTLNIPQEWANKSLLDLPLGYRSLLIDILQEQTSTGRYSEKKRREKEIQEGERNEQRQRDEERWIREEENRQRENEDRNRQKEKKHEQKENYSKQNNSNSKILEYYHVLHLQLGASKQQIKEAYREMSKIGHPDHQRGSEYSNEFQKKINEAYEALMNQNP